jgi:hypothetical protein
MRVYDKLAELTAHNDEAKRAAEEEVWRRAGRDDDGPVSRVEFQLRGGVLDELSLRDPAQLGASLDRVWQYCVMWVRLAIPESASRRARWKTDPRWEATRSVVFERPSEPARRIACRGGAGAAQVIGAMRSHLAGSVGLPDVPAATRSAVFAVGEAERFIDGILRVCRHRTSAVTGTTADAVAGDGRRCRAVPLSRVHACPAMGTARGQQILSMQRTHARKPGGVVLGLYERARAVWASPRAQSQRSTASLHGPAIA